MRLTRCVDGTLWTDHASTKLLDWFCTCFFFSPKSFSLLASSLQNSVRQGSARVFREKGELYLVVFRLYSDETPILDWKRCLAASIWANAAAGMRLDHGPIHWQWPLLQIWKKYRQNGADQLLIRMRRIDNCICGVWKHYQKLINCKGLNRLWASGASRKCLVECRQWTSVFEKLFHWSRAWVITKIWTIAITLAIVYRNQSRIR